MRVEGLGVEGTGDDGEGERVMRECVKGLCACVITKHLLP